MIFVVYKEKNMKKSKIIVPALAMIAFSTAASIAGSVAWFTASRQVTVNAGTYAVVKTTTNLQVDVADGIGATANNNSKSISVGTNLLTDASFDHDDEVIFVPNADGTDIDDTKTQPLATATANNLKRETLTGGAVVYSAITWEISFTLGFGATSGNYGLYLDEENSSFVGSGSQNYTAKGFRMAFVPFDPAGYSISSGSSRDKVVYAGLQESGKCTYVADDTDFDGTAYSTAENEKVLVYQGYHNDHALPAEGEGVTDRADYLGTFGFIANTSVKLCYKVVCWFEGTDENVVNQDDPAKYQSVEATLKFSAIKMA